MYHCNFTLDILIMEGTIINNSVNKYFFSALTIKMHSLTTALVVVGFILSIVNTGMKISLKSSTLAFIVIVDLCDSEL